MNYFTKAIESMKKLLIIIFLFCEVAASAQKVDKFSLSTTIGTGMSMEVPSHTPQECHVAGHYHINNRLNVGIGTGVSLFEKALIPIYVNIQYDFTKDKTLIPFASCNIGYGLAPANDAHGGFYLNPSIGMSYRLKCGRVFLSVGYEFQELDRRKCQSQDFFDVEFAEHISHHLLALQVGYVFPIP